MGILRDFIDTMRDVSQIGSVEEFFKRKKYSSISKRSIEGTLQFPVMASKSLDIETLQTQTKSLERQFATFVQITFTMSPFLNVRSDKDAIGYLRRFHQNTNVKTDMKDIVNFGIDNLEESYSSFSDESGNVYVFTAIYENAEGNVVAANKDQLESMMDSLRQDVLNDKFVPRDNNTYIFASESLSSYHNKRGIVLEAPTSRDIRQAQNTLRSAGMDTGDAYRVARDAELDAQNAQQNRLKNDRDAANLDVQYRKLDIEQRKLDKAPSRKDMDVTIVPQNILKDNDVRKANELVPTTMHIRTILVNDENEEQGFMDFVIGVKATMHPIASDEMITNLVNACKNNNKFFNFIRWTTGEISFFKDFLFDIKQIKDDVMDRSAGASPFWIALKRRRRLAKMKDNLFMPNQILPNTSIVVSMEEVDFIKSNYGFDLMNPSFVDKIMQQYFLLSFVIVDNSSQISHFMFDGQTAFQSTTFSALERENTNKANDFKEMLKLINRV